MFNEKVKLVFFGIVGTFLEWVDYSIYGYLAAKIAAQFFPYIDKGNGLLITYGIFAAGFLARPFGAILFGHIGDTYGRKHALAFSISLMGGATIALGLLPTYNEVGILGPVLLLVCRILQGFALAGENNGAAIFLIEHSKFGQRNFAGSCVSGAATAGMLFGALLVSVISYESLPVWCWRIPFCIGSLSFLVGFCLRYNVSESPVFSAMKAQKMQSTMVPLIAVLKFDKLAMLQAAAVAVFIGVDVYICNVFFATYLTQYGNFSEHSALMIVAFGQGIAVLLMPVMGKIADIWSGRALMLIGLLGAAIVAPLIFFLGMLHSLSMALFGQFIYALFGAMTCAPVYNYLQDLFPTQRRYTGVTLAWGCGIGLFGGTAPLIAQYLVGTLDAWQGPAIYVSISAIIAFLAILVRTPAKSASNLQVACAPNV